MARLIPLRAIFLKHLVNLAGVAALVCAPGSIAWAQHGGGHGGGGGHFGGGGGGHMSSPHVSAPPAPHFSAPVHAPGPIGAGTHNYVAAPPPAVHLSARPGVNQPVIGNRIGNGLVGGATITPAQPLLTVPSPHVIIGFPPAGNNARVLPSTGSGPLSFSGEGREIWRNSAPVTASPEWMHPRRPIYPIHPPGAPVRGRPIFGAPVYGYGYGFGYPFFGFGWGGGLGWGAGWGLGGCDPYWSGGVGCGLFPYYDYGYGDYGNYGGNYSAGNVESQIESQQGPSLYGNGSAPIVYGGNQLVQLYLKDGTVYDVTDYWLVNDNDLHFTTVDASGNATDHVIGFDQLDLQKTIDVNTNNGYRFVLRNEPMREYLQGTEQNTAPAGPMQPGVPPAPPSPPQPGAPPTPPQ
jgi:hypothetical protein